MAGAVGQNIDKQGFIMDPSLAQVQQYYNQLGEAQLFKDSLGKIIGGYRTVKIPTASVLTLNGTPIQIIPAQGSGILALPYLMVATMVYGTATYACNASGAALKWGTAGAGTSCGLTLTQAFIQASSGTNTAFVYPSTTLGTPATTDYNVPVTLIAASTDPTTGDSDLYVRVYWRNIEGLPFSV